MGTSLRARGLARLSGITALSLSLAWGALAGSPSARAEPSSPVITGHGAVGWGFNGRGDLGDGTTTQRTLFGTVGGLGGNVVQVSGGFASSLAVLSDGTVWAWGSNEYGQLGTATTTTYSSVPLQVKGLTGVVAVAAGYGHSLALRSDGTVWAWGNDAAGELGNGETTNSLPTPAEVVGLTGVTKIAAGSTFSLALRSDGTVWAWGGGALGDGTTTSSPVPVRVSGLSQVTDITAGWDTAFALRTQSITTVKSLWAWGRNEDGGLGDGTQTDHLTPEEVTGINAPSIVGVAAGNQFAVALGSDGSVWAWGDNSGGELDAAPSSTPVLRPREAIGIGSGIVQLAANSIGLSYLYYADAVALKSDGTVLAWGDNSRGQLGDGNTAPHVGAVQVAGLTGVTQVSEGSAFTLAVTTLASVPNVVHQTTTLASSTLRAAGFVLGPVTYATDYTCDYLNVVKWQSPAAGTSAILGSPVRVTVGVRPLVPCP